MRNDAAALREQFRLDPEVAFLNHGSFGATPKPVLARLRQWQEEVEVQPVEFYQRRVGPLMAEARAALGRLVNADPDDLVYVSNATQGVTIVARSLKLAPGDEILTTDHEYGACDRTWTFLCERSGAVYRHASLGAPVTTHADFVERCWAEVTPRTKVIFLSHITSPTALTFPVADLCRRARAAGILTIVDGAHALGQIPLDMQAIGADAYTSNGHKWLCGPKGTGFLYVRREVQPLIDPLIVSWGWRPEPGTRHAEGSRFQRENEWQGTRDLGPYLALAAAIEFQQQFGWDEVRARCQALIRETRGRLLDLTGLPPLAPDTGEWFQQMVAVALPIPSEARPALKAALYDRHRIEIPINEWQGQQLLRVSCQGYNDRADMDRLLAALAAELRH